MSKKVIGFHYTLKDQAGTILDSSNGGEPLFFLQDAGQIIPGLEREIILMNVGDKKKVEVKASEAYGDVVSDLVVTVKRNQFPEGAVLNVGDQFQVNNDPQAPVFTIKAIVGEDVTIDGNHPMAGKDLFFDVEVTDKRDATAEELSHGHAHGPHGHHHH